MTEHGKQTFMVLVYEWAAARGDDPFTLVATAGPFETLQAAGEALKESGWVARTGEPMVWQAPSKRWLSAEILRAGDSVPAG